MRWPQSRSDGEPVVCGCGRVPAVDVCGGVPHHAAGHVRSLPGDDRSLHQGSGQNPRGKFFVFSFVSGWWLSTAACYERSSEYSCACSGPQYASREDNGSSLMCCPLCQQVHKYSHTITILTIEESETLHSKMVTGIFMVYIRQKLAGKKNVSHSQ